MRLLVLSYLLCLASCVNSTKSMYVLEMEQRQSCALYKETVDAELEKAIKGTISTDSLMILYSKRPKGPLRLCEIGPKTIYASQVSPRPEDYDKALFRLASISYRDVILRNQCQGADSRDICEIQKRMYWDQIN